MSKNIDAALEAVSAEAPAKRTRTVKAKTFLVGFTIADGKIVVADKVNLSALGSAEAVAKYREFTEAGYQTVELSI